MRTFGLIAIAYVAGRVEAQEEEEEKNLEFGSRPLLVGQYYQALWAEEKYGRVWDLIESNPQEVAEIPWTGLGYFFEQNSGKSLTAVMDDMPREPNKRRIKFVHQQGLVAPVKLVLDPEADNPYTGLFDLSLGENSGGEYGVARISESGFGVEGLNKVNPSAAVKIFRDGVPSGNMVYMNSFEDQDGKDFFEADLTTQPEPIAGDNCINTVQRKLTEASKHPFSQSTLGWCKYDQFGNEEIDDLKFPYEMVLQATDELKAASAAWAATKGASDYGAAYFESLVDILQVPADSTVTIWNILTRAEPESDLVKIGTIDATESFRASQYADEQLFFQHESWETVLGHFQAKGDIDSRRSWERNTFKSTVQAWGNEAEPLPEDPAEAEAVIQVGALNYGCPFAWLINDINGY